jgi:hypothetical protein
MAGTDQLGPARAVDEQVVEGHALDDRRIGGLDYRQPVAQRASAAPRELELVALLELAAGLEDAADLVLPAGDVRALKAGREG